MCEPSVFPENNQFECIESKFDNDIHQEMKKLLKTNIEKVV